MQNSPRLKTISLKNICFFTFTYITVMLLLNSTS